jgi:purine-binding chemotaxis protein CheW
VVIVNGPRDQLVAFTLDERCFALRLESVERIVRTVEVTALPKAPEIVLGVINVQGKIVPVLDIRARFGLPKREFSLSDEMVVARTKRRTVVFNVDSVSAIIARRPEDITAAERILPDLKYVQGVAKLRDGMVVIHDLDRFLSLDEAEQLEGALTRTE